ncbi:MAG TPA: phosphodiesterase [Pseudomonas sp.]|uniref:phosphodiesterase n=1 Tax=Pseudomonas sp. TaxID=306 RepID=UPI002C135D09|nr:phosphodiesterase [Pseudomonas sp.]HTO20688.1 phosphodiesterase [Pseudomonas sp.]
MTRFAFLFALLLPFSVLADTLSVPVGQQGDARLQLPRQGETQQSVETRYGSPETRHPAVGQPPISRWDYPGFSVYFESGKVIDSVRHPRPTPAQGQ